ncbi:MAG: ABC transporter substrate-binding protein [Alphaproteobacteria bacterium]|nr:ABC transporter substrate-binding protein [Alphaproteobacteria bacterium]MDX5369994.1 ABC transporter substrate-binding protein [Alphaproteobacteria bacterium]MDX5464572.1 ABC transporter substrate-binding protein [Alphaproteobacteria bacterium]
MRKGWIALAALFAVSSAQAAEKTEIDFVLNWIAGGDHAPYYYAQQEGWYEKAGIDLNIEQGKGSAAAAQRTGIGQTDIGLADMGTALVARGKGANLVAVMNVYANSPYGMYWLKSSGIKGIQDFPGHKIGNPPSDAARAMWPALAKKNGLDPDSVTWVNVQPNAKLAALKAKSIDITTSFYNIHHIFQRELGDDMGFFKWSELGINPYGNSLFVNANFLGENQKAVQAFVDVTQRAFRFCVDNPQPCVEALVAANTGLKVDNELENWALVVELMTDKTSQNVALGAFDDARMKDDYTLVETYFDLEQPFDVKTIYTNAFLDKSIKMPK